MNCPAGLSPKTLWLCLTILSVFLCFPGEVTCQTHEWKNRYSPCTKECGEGIQTLQKYCFTKEAIPKPALESFCSGLPIREKDVISCNTFPCGTCERTYTSLSGTITSPHYPDKFSIPRYCRLSVTLPPGNRVLLGFSEFVLEGLQLAAFADLQESTICLCGTLVQVTDQGPKGRFKTYCGTKQTFSWLADSNSVLLEFVTESSQLFNRFKGHYEAISAQPACFEWRDLSKVGKGYVRSPGHPNKYGNGLHCEYVLQADPLHAVSLTLLEFQLEPSPDCDLDYLVIEDMYSRRQQTFCGTLGDTLWSSDSNEVRLIFHSNANDPYKGFAILYQTENQAPEDSQIFTESTGTFTSPGYPLVYPPGASARYRILAPPGRLVAIKFTDFELERADTQAQPVPLPRQRRSTLAVLQYAKGGPCDEVDHVTIYDKLAGTANDYCGKLPPFSWFSQSNEVTIQFVSDADENYKGFSADYRTVEKRPASEWELVFRAASVTETDPVRKWQDTSRSYAQWDPKAKSVLKEDSPRTFKARKVNNWQELQVRKVKVELYKAGKVVAAFHFKNLPNDDIDDWFTCTQLIYASYEDLLHIDCLDLVFSTVDNFAITDSLGSSGLTCSNNTARLWLDIQDRVPSPTSPSVCLYERAASSIAKFFHSLGPDAGLTATGTNIATADVITIWIERDCDQIFTDITTMTEFESEDYGVSRGYPNYEYCDYYFLNEPYDRILLHFRDFSVEYDKTCSKDYVEIEDLTTGRTDRFCGNQHHPLFTTDGNAAVMRFRTDGFSTFPGWRAEASPEGRNNEDCSSIVTDASGNLTNADYPMPLTHFRLQGCETLLHGPIADRVTASFTKVMVDLEDCPELTIIDHVSSSPITEVSGRVLPFSWTSVSNELILWYCASLPYRSYLYYEGNFRTTISPSPATCVQYIDAEFSGTFDWPSTSLITGAKNCYIVIRTHPVLNYRINLTIKNLVLKDLDCNSYIKMTDTTTQRSDTTCTTARQPFTWTSDANEVIVQFVSGSSVSVHTVEGYFSSGPRPKLDESQTFTGTQGTFASPNYPEDYPADLRMDYLFHGKAHEIVFLNFQELILELPSTTPVGRPRGRRHVPDHILYKRQAITTSRTACEYDYIEITDNLDTARNVKYCGNQLPFSWVSSGNEALVTLVTDSSVVKKGFKAEYIFQQRPGPAGCGGIYEASVGGFNSPGYPGIYPRDADCTYSILALANQRIRLTFKSFNTESDDECDKDSVEVTDKLSSKADRYCGNQQTPFSWTSDSNLVFVIFRSNGDRQYGGFTAEYEFEDRPEKTVCQYNFDAQTGEIQSPMSSGEYPNLRECNYVVTVETGFGIHLTFVEFNLEGPAPDGKCKYDYLQIEDAVSGTSDKLCGNKDPFERVIGTNQVTVTFKSDLIVFYKGFRAVYEQVDLSTHSDCDKKFTTSSGVFTSPGYPTNYPNGKHCRYTIVVAADQRIKITFSAFSLESSTNCLFDYVEVSDVGRSNEERFCSRKPDPFSWLSEGHDVQVVFHSDDRTPSTGFSAKYESEPLPVQAAVNTGCNADYNIVLRDSTGKMTSPAYPRQYPLDIECKMRVELADGILCEVTFTDFQLEDYYQGNWCYDYVQLTSIPDGDTISYCGTMSTPFTWRSKSNSCEVLFYSDSVQQAGGYKAIYDAVGASPTPTPGPAQSTPPPSACTQDLQGPAGTFASLNYPGKYPTSVDCVTTITVASGQRVKIVFDEFDVEYNDDCEWDWVQITDLGTDKSVKYCGVYKSGLDYQSTTNEVSVALHSDDMAPRPGYSARFSAVP